MRALADFLADHFELALTVAGAFGLIMILATLN
jgi:hypothetical protein